LSFVYLIEGNDGRALRPMPSQSTAKNRRGAKGVEALAFLLLVGLLRTHLESEVKLRKKNPIPAPYPGSITVVSPSGTAVALGSRTLFGVIDNVLRNFLGSEGKYTGATLAVTP